ncbi:MAG: LPS export ABC transporter ATP-binding protein [Holosporaceae bacterium]|jgi:lipopolysaccharide export system ATP-binding protein|nr:LPS export ABC transporter ATP-binding protein [Holosporaceae bacterium]
MNTGIVCKNLKKIINRKSILKDINFKASRGEIVALLGPNGAGKTTSFSILCGLIKPDSGHVFLNGRDITELPMYKRARLGIGYLPQESSIFKGLTVEENIIAVLEMNKIKKNKWPVILEKLLNDLSLKHVKKSQAISISGGERRKLEIARSLATEPDFMLLDEPLAGIDPLAVAEMRDMIFALKNKGIGVIISDHNVRDTLPLADYAYILFEGQILVEGTPKQIIKNSIARKIYLGESFSVYNSPYERES